MKLRCLLLLVTIACLGKIHAQDTLFIDDSFGAAQAGNYFWQAQGSGQLVFDSSSPKWKPNRNKLVKLSRNENHQLYMVIKNVGTSDRMLELTLNNPQLGESALYTRDGLLVDTIGYTGSLVAKKNRASDDRMMSFPIQIDSGMVMGLYLVTGRKEINLTIQPVLSDPARVVTNKNSDLLITIVLSALGLIMIAAITGVSFIKAPDTWWFLAFVFFSSWYVIAGSGLGSLHFWSGIGWFEENAKMIFKAGASISFIQFSRHIIRTQVGYKRLNKFLKGFNATYVLVSLLAFSMYPGLLPGGSFTLVLNCLNIVLVFLLLVLAEIGYYNATIKQQPYFWWFLGGVLVYINFIVSSLLFDMQVLQYTPFFYNLFVICGIVQPVLFMMVFMLNRVLGFVANRNNEIAKLKIMNSQALVEERLRVGRELHDELGSMMIDLSSSGKQGMDGLENNNPEEVRRALQNVDSSSSLLASKLNDIVWLLTPDQDSAGCLADRLAGYAASIAGDNDMTVEVNVPDDLALFSLPFEYRRQFYLIGKEAITNAITHSEGTSLRIRLGLQDGNLLLSVTDNGKGFDALSAAAGPGIRKMKKSAEHVSGVLHLNTVPGQGSTILLQVPLE